MPHGGSDINIANIILALVLPIVSGVVAASVTHKLAHERQLRDTARQLFADILRNASRHRHALGRLRMFYQMVHSQNVGETEKQYAFQQINEIGIDFAGYGSELGAITFSLQMTFGPKANKLAEILSQYLAPLSIDNLTDDAFDKMVHKFDSLRAELIPELNRVSRSLRVTFTDDDIA